MSIISTLPDRLCEWFSDMNEFADCGFCTQFPPDAKASPLVKPIAVFGIKSFKILENTPDSSGTVLTEDRNSQIVFSIKIHVPKNMGGTVCYTFFDRIADNILFNTDFSVKEVSVSDIDYIRNTDSLCISADFSISDTFLKGSNYAVGFKS